jgi:hypothetical protein
MRLPTDWMNEAACIGSVLDFASDQEDQRCVDVCNQCSVKMVCRSYAYVHDEYGTWGGTHHTIRFKEARREGVVRSRDKARRSFDHYYKQWREKQC